MNDLYADTQRFTDMAAQALEDGDALGTYVYLHLLEKAVGEAKKMVQDAAIEERERYDRKAEILRHGVVVSVMETSRFSYDDPEIDRLKILIKAREEKCKNAYTFASKGSVFIDENGEEIPPAEKKSIVTLKTEYKKG